MSRARHHLIRIVASVAAAVVLVAPAASAQGVISADSSYFPMHDRNEWSYVTVLDPPDQPADTLRYDVTTVSHPIEINDTLYHRIEYPFALADTVRRDGDGNVWARKHGADLLLFDFSLDDGATYTYLPPTWPEMAYVVTVRHHDVMEVSAGTFENTITLRFDDPDVVDEETFFTFARRTGIVQASGQMGDYVELDDAELYPIPDTLDWHGYFPLEQGSRWQYEFEDWDGTFGTIAEWVEDWFITGDTLIDDVPYHVVEVRCSSISSSDGLDDPPACVPETVEERFFRYDEEWANVIELRTNRDPVDERSVFNHDIRLDAPFFYMEDFGSGGAGIEYVRPEEPLIIGEQVIEAVQKCVAVESAVPGGMTFAHGIGLIHMEFSEHGGRRQELTYVDVGATSYGSARPVASVLPAKAVADYAINAYPNPAAGDVHLKYTLPAQADVFLEIYDAVGRRVRSVEVGRKTSGIHTDELDTGELASGTYTLALQTEGTPRAYATVVVVR